MSEIHSENVGELADQGRGASKLRCRMSSGRKGSSKVGDDGSYTVARRGVWHLEAMRELFDCVRDADSSCRWYIL